MQQNTTRLPFDPPRYSYDDYKNWSDEWEMIDGYPYSLMPSGKKAPAFYFPFCPVSWKYLGWKRLRL